MKDTFSGYMPLAGRILLGTIFIVSGIGKLMDPGGTQQYMASMGMPWTGFFLAAAIVTELVGGLSLFLGYFTRLGAAVLFLFMIPTTLIFHTNFSDPNQMIHFLKNVSMMGGLLYVVTYGAGRISIDAQEEKPGERISETVAYPRSRTGT